MLNAAHPDNGGKASFFNSLGFSAEASEVFAAALREMAACTPVATTVATVHGRKYVLDGTLRGPRGAEGSTRSIWIIERGGAAPRLVTAYPRG